VARANRHYIPGQWPHAGYNEIQRPRRKNILIDYEKLGHLSGFNNFEDFQSAHRRWVQSALSDGKAKREERWTQSIATGSRSFVEAVKMQMGSFATGRRVQKKVEGFELQEPQSPYNALFDTEKNDIEDENLWFWNE
jgi:putative transposase